MNARLKMGDLAVFKYRLHAGKSAATRICMQTHYPNWEVNNYLGIRRTKAARKQSRQVAPQAVIEVNRVGDGSNMNPNAGCNALR